MLCGLKKQLPTVGSPVTSKKRKPTHCLSGQDDGYYPLYPSSKKTIRSSRTTEKENLPVALSKLHLINGRNKANLPLDTHTGALVAKHMDDHSEDAVNKAEKSEQRAFKLDRFLNQTNNNNSMLTSSKQSLLSSMTNCSSLPTIDNISKTSLQKQPVESNRSELVGKTSGVLSNQDGVSKEKKFEFNSKGQLKVHLSSQDKSLIIRVQEAKQLRSSWSSVCNAFVKVQICPHTKSGGTFETSIVQESNNPSFNQDIIVNLTSEDIAKRLVISVWHQDTRKNCSEFLGCLSFGLKHLVHKTRHGRVIDGNYHILPESMGHRKHILVENSEENKPLRPSVCNDKKTITPSHILPHLTPGGFTDRTEETILENDDVVVKTLKIHYKNGYGFTVRNTKPVTIGRVKQNGAAFAAGLHPGDVITKINGKSLDPLTAEDAALMVRYSKDHVILDVQCPHYKESMKDYFETYMKPWSRSTQPIPTLDLGSSQESLNRVQTSRISSGSKSSRSKAPTSRDIWDLYRNTKSQRRVSGDGEVNDTGFTENSTMYNNNTTEVSQTVELNDRLSVSKWDPSLSYITQNSRHYTYSYRNDSYTEALDNNIHSELDQTDCGNSTFSLATEADSIGRVKTKRGYHRHIPYQPNNTMVTESTQNDDDQNNCSYETDVDVTIGTEEGIEWSHNDDTMTTEVSDPPSYGMENRGFFSDDEIMNESCMLGSEYYTDYDETQHHLTNTPTCKKTTTQIIEDRISRQVHHNSQSDISSTGSIDEYWLICSPRSQENFVEELVKEECRFIINMERGIKKYLWASRCVLQGQDFHVIFQNMEKLMAISNFIQQQMRDELDRSEVTHFRAVLDVYKNKISMLLEAYSTYINGLAKALTTLDECKLHSLDFQQFLHEVWEHERHLSIDDFLLLPVHHLTSIKAVFEEMVQKCPTDQDVGRVLDGITTVVENLPDFDDFPHSIVEPTQ